MTPSIGLLTVGAYDTPDTVDALINLFSRRRSAGFATEEQCSTPDTDCGSRNSQGSRQFKDTYAPNIYQSCLRIPAFTV